MSETPRHLRTVKSYVIRAGRMTTSQRKAIDELWPRYGLDPEAGELRSADVFGRRAPLVLEIGFGMGEALFEMARTHQEEDFIGVEVHPPGVGNLLKLAQAEGLDNLRVYQADAVEVLKRCIAPGSLARVQVFFPDPWHKKKHHKRRLIQAPFVQELRRHLAAGGLLHLATDWQPYAEHMLEVMSAAEGFENVFGAGNWATEHERPRTKFERRGEKLGHGVWDLIFRRTA